MSYTLHDLGADREVLDQWLLETEGEETPEIAELWDLLHGNQVTKVANWGLWIREAELELAAVEAEKARFEAKRKSLAAAIDRSRARLLYEMERQGIPNVKTPKCSVDIRLNNPSVEVDESKITPEWLAIEWQEHGDAGCVVRKVEYAVDKKGILQSAKIQSDATLPEGIAIVRTKRLAIK